MTKIDGTPWIKVKDFQKTFLWIAITNTTTGISISDTDDVELTEVAENGMTLKLPINSCSFGHLLEIEILCQVKHLLANGQEPPISQEGTKITVTAKIAAEEALNNTSKTATLQFYQYNEKLWKSFIAQFSKRQKDLTALFDRMKE